MMKKKSDDAVSPVIGVMLMLVITVVIAGVIAAFGAGMVGDTESAPSVVLDVKILDYYQALTDVGGPDFQIRHVSGEPLDTDEIEIQIAWSEDVDKDGKYTNHRSTYSAATFKEKYPNYLPAHGGIGGGTRAQPMYVKVENIPDKIVYTYGTGETPVGGIHDYYFGDVVLTTGMRLTASADMLKQNVEAVGSPYMDVIFNNGNVITTNVETEQGIMAYLPVGTPVDITILHIPSNTIIYEKEVVVQ